jgi:hypothetical protein
VSLAGDISVPQCRRCGSRRPGTAAQRDCATRDSAIAIKLRARIDSSKAERDSLIASGQRQTRVHQQLVCG